MASPANTYAGGYVPTKPVVDLMDTWIAEQDSTSRYASIGLLICEIWPEEVEGLELKQIYQTKYERLLRNYRVRKWMMFDAADLIVTHLGGWGQSEELAEAYRKVNLAQVDLTYPTCPEVREKTVQRLRNMAAELGGPTRVAQALGVSIHTTGKILRGAA